MAEQRKYNVGLVQMSMGPEPEANLESAVAHVREAAKRGAQVICLPELFRAQYFCQREDLRLFDLAEPIPGPSTKRLGDLARELRVVIVASLFERRAPGLYHNTAVTLGADGAILSVYRKMHIPDDPLYYEKYYFTPGDLGFKAADTPVGRIGTLVCWDQWYPEGARLTALQGAEILFYPTAIGWHPAEKDEFGEAQYDAWQTIQRAHAIANGVYVAGVNRVGHENGDVLGNRAEGPGLQFWGGSFLADPFGRILAKASHDKEEILIGTVDLALLEDTRRNWPFLRDRRIDAFAPITRRFLDAPAYQSMPSQHRLYADARRENISIGETANELMGSPRFDADKIPEEEKNGIYAVFLKKKTTLPYISKLDSELLYIGKTKTGLGSRIPIAKKNPSSHTFLRTLGALLKSELSLRAIANSEGSITNYRFDAPSEERLADWIQSNLVSSYVVIDGEIAAIESQLIEQFCPPLNIAGNKKNPNRSLIKHLREICRLEAASNFSEDAN